MSHVTRVLLPKPFTMMLLPTPLMILLRRESLKSDNSDKEAHDESDKGIAAQAVHNDATTSSTASKCQLYCYIPAKPKAHAG